MPTFTESDLNVSQLEIDQLKAALANNGIANAFPNTIAEQLAKVDDYTEHRYHNFSDNYTPDMDFTADAKLARFGMELGWEALSAPGTIQWKAGDEFEGARKKSLGE